MQRLPYVEGVADGHVGGVDVVVDRWDSRPRGTNPVNPVLGPVRGRKVELILEYVWSVLVCVCVCVGGGTTASGEVRHHHVSVNALLGCCWGFCWGCCWVVGVLLGC